MSVRISAGAFVSLLVLWLRLICLQLKWPLFLHLYHTLLPSLFIWSYNLNSFCSLSCGIRYLVSRGSYAILFLLVLAEVTSACQNTWTLARVRRDDVSFAAKLYAVLSPPFYAFYAVVRGLVAPAFVFKMGAFYISGQADGLVPRWVWVSWITVVVIALLVSISWISGLWCELYAEKTDKMKKKAWQASPLSYEVSPH